MATKYKYFLKTKSGKYKDEFLSYGDIACEYLVTRNVIAGKFNRAHKNHENTICICGDMIEQFIIRS